MAVKSGVSYAPEQVEALANVVVGMQSALDADWMETNKVIKTLESEEVFGESEQKKAVLEGVQSLKEIRTREENIITAMVDSIKAVNEAALAAANANIKNVSEAASNLAAAKKKINEAK